MSIEKDITKDELKYNATIHCKPTNIYGIKYDFIINDRCFNKTTIHISCSYGNYKTKYIYHSRANKTELKPN